MKIDQFTISAGEISYSYQSIEDSSKASFILVFASRVMLESPSWMANIQNTYQGAPVVSCSSSGMIYQSLVKEEDVSGVAIQLEKTKFRIDVKQLSDFSDSKEMGKQLATDLQSNGLKHILLFSDGWLVNGSDLIEGVYSFVSKDVSVGGGFAGDGANFSRTLIGLNQRIERGLVVAIGMYGEDLSVGFGKHGGWNEFGIEMEVTTVNDREIFQLNNQSALDLYKEFLGSDADGLPGKALMYPISVKLPGYPNPLVRTVMNIDEIEGSIITGEPIPKGAKVQFMRAQFNNIIKGVEQAVKMSLKNHDSSPDFALVVSCVGRKLLFGKQIEEEITITKKALGNTPAVSGFYSNGEICMDERGLAELHHQYLTVTTFSEM